MKRRRGAAVAAALKHGKKKGGKKAKKGQDHAHHAVVVEDDPLREFLEQNRDADQMFGKRVMMIEKIIAHKNANEKVVLKPTDRKDILRQRQIDGMTPAATPASVRPASVNPALNPTTPRVCNGVLTTAPSASPSDALTSARRKAEVLPCDPVTAL